MNREKELEKIIIDTFWMAERYACGRRTYAPEIIKESKNKLKELGIVMREDKELEKIKAENNKYD